MIYGERVKQARELCGLTQTELARLVGVNQPTIAHIESERNFPSEDLLISIASHTGFLTSFFEQKPLDYFPVGSLNFRARAALTAREKGRAYQYAKVVFEQALAMLGRLNIPSVAIPCLPDTPDMAARVTRDALGVSPDVPMGNLVHAIERSGGLVLALPIELKRVDAFSACVPLEIERSETTRVEIDRPVIAFLSGKPGDRLRFSVAHELGHLVMHKAIKQPLKVLEKEADQFAAELLLPEKAMRECITPPVTLASLATLKKEWKVSIQALIHRAYELRLITERQYRYLFEQLSARGWRTREPSNLDVPVEKPRTYRKMVEVLYGDPNDVKRYASDMHITIERANEIINEFALSPGLPPQDSEHIVNQSFIQRN